MPITVFFCNGLRACGSLYADPNMTPNTRTMSLTNKGVPKGNKSVEASATLRVG